MANSAVAAEVALVFKYGWNLGDFTGDFTGDFIGDLVLIS